MLIRLICLLPLVATLSTAQWRALGPFGGSAEVIRVSALQPGLVIAATHDALIYKSVDAGLSWSNLPFPLQLESTLHSLEIDPRDQNKWYAGIEHYIPSASGLYRSLDAGRSWNLVTPLQGKPVWSIAILDSDPRVIAVGAADGVYLSNDEGLTWSLISPPDNFDLRPIVALEFGSADGKVIYAGTPHLPWRTIDGGQTWQSIHDGMIDDSDVFSIQVDLRRPETLFASACSGVYRSGNRGEFWTRLPTPQGAFRTYFVAVDPRRPATLFAGTTAGLIKSRDGGGAWRTVSSDIVKSVAFDPFQDNRTYFASTTSGLLRSIDYGETLQPINDGFANHNFTAVSFSGSTLYTSTAYEPGGGLFRADASTPNWSVRSIPAIDGETILSLAVQPGNPDVVFAGVHGGMLKSTNGGRTWVKLTVGPRARIVSALLPIASHPGELLAATDAGLFRTLNSGVSWIPVRTGSRDELGIRLLEGSGRRGVALVSDNGIFLSNDEGQSWTSCSVPAPDIRWYGVTFDSPGERWVLAATSNGMFRSTNRCNSWVLIQNGIAAGTVATALSDPERPEEVFTTQGGKVFRSLDAGLRWQPLPDGDRNGAYPAALFLVPEYPDRVYALFPRRGIFFNHIRVSATGPE